MTTTFRLSSPSEIIALLPYQMGFHPRRCLVAVSMHDRRFGLVQRLDLPPVEHVRQAARVLLPGLLREPPTAVLLVGYEDTPGESEPLLDAAAQVCLDRDIGVVDRLVVRDGRWLSLHCSDPRCCPPSGTPVVDSASVPAVAELVGQGRFPLADRDELAARLRPTRPLLVRAVDAAVDVELQARVAAARAWKRGDVGPMRQRWRAELEAWREVLDPQPARPAHARVIGPGPAAGSADRAERGLGLDLRPEQLARVAVAMLDRDLRDALLSWLCPGWMDLAPFHPAMAEAVRELVTPLPGGTSGPGERPAPAADPAELVQQRLTVLCGCLPETWAPGPLCVLAWVAWWRGDGVVARVALERVEQLDPGYRLAQLMHQMLDQAMRPRPDGGRGRRRRRKPGDRGAA